MGWIAIGAAVVSISAMIVLIIGVLEVSHFLKRFFGVKE